MRRAGMPRSGIAFMLVVLLVASSVPLFGRPTVHAQDDPVIVPPIVATVALAGLVGVIVYFARIGGEMIEERIADQLVARGCPVPDQVDQTALDACIRRTDYLAAHPETDPRVAEMILHGQFSMGMTAAQVEASVGAPSRINRSVTAFGATEQWVYRTSEGYSANYLYFDDGILRSWQVSR